LAAIKAPSRAIGFCRHAIHFKRAMTSGADGGGSHAVVNPFKRTKEGSGNLVIASMRSHAPSM
jgi:hypothetical protein